MTNNDNSSRSGGRFHRYDFDEMDAFDPITVEEELRRQAQYVSTDKKSTFMKRLHFKADGIPKTIKVEIEKEDYKSSSGGAACTIASSSTDNTTASSQRSASDSQLDESLNWFHRGQSFKERRAPSLSDNQLVQSTSRNSSKRQSKSQRHHHHETTPTVSEAASSQRSASDSQLDESLNSFHGGQSFKERRARSLSDSQLAQSTRRNSSKRQSKSQRHHHHETTLTVSEAALLQEVYACDPSRELDMMRGCTHNRSTRSVRMVDTREQRGEAVNPLSHKSKYVDLPSKSRRHSRTPERPQRSSSRTMNHETRGPWGKTSHLDHLFAGPTAIAGPTNSSRGVRREERPKAHSYHNRSEPNVGRPPRRVNSVDRGAHLNSLFSPSGPELKVPQMNRSHSTRR